MTIFLPQTTYVLHVETRDDADGIWLCLDDGVVSIPLAQFVSEHAAEQYKQALNYAVMKAHAMGRFGV